MQTVLAQLHFTENGLNKDSYEAHWKEFTEKVTI